METILGIFDTRDNADEAISELERNYFSPQDISVITKNTKEVVKINDSSVEENVGIGAANGVVTGGILASLAGILIGAGVMAVPGIGVFLIGGPIAAALGLTGAAAFTVSAATTGAVAGGIIGALVGLGLPTERAKEYEQYVRGGAILLAVQAFKKTESKMVKHIFSKSNARQIRSVMGNDSRLIGRNL